MSRTKEAKIALVPGRADLADLGTRPAQTTGWECDFVLLPAKLLQLATGPGAVR